MDRGQQVLHREPITLKIHTPKTVDLKVQQRRREPLVACRLRRTGFDRGDNPIDRPNTAGFPGEEAPADLVRCDRSAHKVWRLPLCPAHVKKQRAASMLSCDFEFRLFWCKPG